MLLGVLPNCTLTIAIEDVNNMGIFCLSKYEMEMKNGKYIKLQPEKLECIKSYFHEATHALIIFEPEKFINDV